MLLNRYDLFHTHLILDYAQSDMVLLFHAREYPAYEKDNFPYILGYCQAGSTMPYAPIAMDFRNFVWYKVGLLLDSILQVILMNSFDILRDLIRIVLEASCPYYICLLQFWSGAVLTDTLCFIDGAPTFIRF